MISAYTDGAMVSVDNLLPDVISWLPSVTLDGGLCPEQILEG